MQNLKATNSPAQGRPKQDEPVSAHKTSSPPEANRDSNLSFSRLFDNNTTVQFMKKISDELEKIKHHKTTAVNTKKKLEELVTSLET